MRAAVVRTLGDLRNLTLETLPPPPMAPDQVRVAVYAAGVNFADGLMVLGTYQEKPPLPFSPGFEIAGTILELGAEVTGFAVGQRIIGLVSWGGYADEAVADAANLFPFPAEMPFTEAAGFSIAYGTSYGALDWRAHLQPGETLLVHGAAGGVGLTAVEIGKAMGATVIATAGTAEKLDIARSRGADHLIDTTTEDVRQRVKDITGGRGVDVAYDPVGGDAFDVSLRSIAWEGRILIIGFAGGTIPKIPANLLLVKNCSAIGFYWGAYRTRNPPLVRRAFDTMFDWYKADRLKPRVSATFDLADAADAIELLRSRKATGKVVLTTGR
jgi:NADPH2:quinone reductase